MSKTPASLQGSLTALFISSDTRDHMDVAEKYDQMKDYSVANFMYEVAARRGNVDAQIIMGDNLLEGGDLLKNIDWLHSSVDILEALDWYEIAAQNGSELALHKMEVVQMALLKLPNCTFNSEILLLVEGIQAFFDTVKTNHTTPPPLPEVNPPAILPL